MILVPRPPDPAPVPSADPVPPPVPPVVDGDERMLFRQLGQMVADGRLVLTVDRRLISHIDFPLSVEADGNRWVYGLAVISLGIGWLVGWQAGVGALGASFVIYQTLGRRDVTRRLHRRIVERGLTSLDDWRRVWRFGGVMLAPPGGEAIRGPAESWMALVRRVESGAPPV